MSSKNIFETESAESLLHKKNLRDTNYSSKFASAENQNKFIRETRLPAELPPTPSVTANFAPSLRRVDGFPVFTLTPKVALPGPIKHVIYLHGGAYTNIMSEHHWNMLGAFLPLAGASATVPLYGLAPEFGFAEAHELVTNVYRECVEKYGSESITIMGDSAGGGLALAFAQTLKEKHLPPPRNLLLLCPWLDIRLCDPDCGDVAKRDPMLQIEGCIEAGRLWAHGTDPKNPLVSPMFGPLSGLPPIDIYMGTDDLLLPDIRKGVEKMKAAGQIVRYHEYLKMAHVWMLFAMPERDHALSEMAKI